MKSRNTLLLMAFASVALLLAASTPEEKTSGTAAGEKWVAPASADKIKNPLADNAKAWKRGKKTYDAMCAICHGTKGKGDGIAGMALKPRPADLTSKDVQSQSDGAIYWKLTTGKPPMASYKALLKDKQRWELVNYIRKLKK